jgi:hypothetical protein
MNYILTLYLYNPKLDIMNWQLGNCLYIGLGYLVPQYRCNLSIFLDVINDYIDHHELPKFVPILNIPFKR